MLQSKIFLYKAIKLCAILDFLSVFVVKFDSLFPFLVVVFELTFVVVAFLIILPALFAFESRIVVVAFLIILAALFVFELIIELFFNLNIKLKI